MFEKFICSEKVITNYIRHNLHTTIVDKLSNLESLLIRFIMKFQFSYWNLMLLVSIHVLQPYLPFSSNPCISISQIWSSYHMSTCSSFFYFLQNFLFSLPFSSFVRVQILALDKLLNFLLNLMLQVRWTLI